MSKFSEVVENMAKMAKIEIISVKDLESDKAGSVVVPDQESSLAFAALLNGSGIAAQAASRNDTHFVFIG